MRTNQYGEKEKRKHPRTAYSASTRPIFRVRGQNVEIKDVSRGGLRFRCQDKIKVRGWVSGRMDLADGTSIEIEGIVVRVDNKDMGLAFISDLKDEVYRRMARQFVRT